MTEAEILKRLAEILECTPEQDLLARAEDLLAQMTEAGVHIRKLEHRVIRLMIELRKDRKAPKRRILRSSDQPSDVCHQALEGGNRHDED